MIRSQYYYFFVFLLIVVRFFHLGELIDQPHDWRQCDTAYYIQDFYENGIDLLFPAVCWMGNSDTLALEFPLPEAIVAVGYNIFGESIPLARICFLIFFLGAVYYFYKVVQILSGVEKARIAVLVYLALPLSLFYSRAVHIDFSVIFLAHAMVYYFFRGIDSRNGWYILLSSVIATLAFLIKIPYAFYWFLPMFIYVVNRRAFRWVLLYGGLYIISVLLFLFWQWHVSIINGNSPEWDYILHYHKMTQNSGWYFGSLKQRLTLYPWWVLLQRGIFEVTGIGGILFFLAGVINLKQETNFSVYLAWIAGVVMFVLIFFNLNFIHNYYQIPLLAPSAILIAGGTQFIYKRWRIPIPLSLGILIISNLYFSESTYYKIDEDREEVARLIRENTPDDALTIVTYKSMDCRDPRVLYRSRRQGWSIQESALNSEVLNRLTTEEGAEYWVHLTKEENEDYLKNLSFDLKKPQVFDLQSRPERLFVYQLKE